MTPLPEWRKFELEMQEKLGLHDTVASGSQWNDPGDGKTGHYSTAPIGIIMDAKTTDNKSFSLVSDFLDDWKQRADELGKTFLLPVRFNGRGTWIVLEEEDFMALLVLAKKGLQSG